MALDGEPYAGRSPDALAAIRNRHLGFVFQFHHLLREFSALENVMLPLLIGGMDPPEAEGRSRILLDSVGLSARLTHRPAALSGGEQQRVAVARALVTEPKVILADEPSGNLDVHNGERLHALFAELTRRSGTAVIVVTHNPGLASLADRVLALEEGHLTAGAGTR